MTMKPGYDILTVIVEAIEEKTALVRDSFGRKHKIGLYPRRGHGVQPRVGETWILDRTLGSWTFAACLIPQAPPVISGPVSESFKTLLQTMDRAGFIVDESVAAGEFGDIENIDAAAIVSGTLNPDRLPLLPGNKVDVLWNNGVNYSILRSVPSSNATGVALGVDPTGMFQIVNNQIKWRVDLDGNVTNGGMPRQPVTRFYSANATWTKPERLVAIRLVMVGGGGGGGGRQAGAGTASVGAGGGAGAYVDLTIPAAALPSSASVVVGAQGVGVAGAQGTNGGDSAFGSYTAKGGRGGLTGTVSTADTYSWAGGGGGTTAGVDNTYGFFINGQDGGRGSWVGGSTLIAHAGAGGSNPLGAGALSPPVGATGFISHGSGFGAGGSGMAGINSSSLGGGNGTPGRVIVTEFFG